MSMAQIAGGNVVRDKYGVDRWIMLCAIPAIALTVAARQVYLSKTEDLSTWKGGGMGMFAAADNSLGRYAKIYMLLPTGQRMPFLRLTPTQEELLRRSLWFPSEKNLRALADSIKMTNWVASSETIPLGRFDENGARVGIDDSVRFHQIRPDPLRPRSERHTLTIEVEYWKAVYDVNTRDMKAALARTFTFKD
jgi:hypothetical protein